MSERMDKRSTLSEAIKKIHDGDRIAFGGFAIYQKPMAAVHEIIRARLKNLTVVGTVNSIDVDMLCGAGALRKVETSYVGLESFGLAQNYRRAVQSGQIEVDYYSEMLAWDRFRANWEALPYWPVYYLGGNDIVKDNKNIIPYTCPVTNKPAWAVPAANPDAVVLHVMLADKYGNAARAEKYMYPQSMDNTLSHCGGTLILTAERIVDTDELMRNPERVFIPSYKTTCVVEVPNGSHPTATLSATATDNGFLRKYAEASKSKEEFGDFIEKYVYNVSGFDEYLRLCKGI